MTTKQALKNIYDFSCNCYCLNLEDEYLYEHRLLRNVFSTTPHQNLILAEFYEQCNSSEFFSVDVFMTYLYSAYFDNPDEVREAICELAKRDIIKISYSCDVNHDNELLICFKNETLELMNKECPAIYGRYTLIEFEDVGEEYM